MTSFIRRVSGNTSRGVLGFSFLILLFAIGVIYAEVSNIVTEIEPQPRTAELPNEASVAEIDAAQGQPIPVIIVDISLRGFEPQNIQRPKGRALIVVYNNSLRPQLNLQLKTLDGTLIKEFSIPRSKRKLTYSSVLHPGQYQIVDTDRPENVLRIEITQ